MFLRPIKDYLKRRLSAWVLDEVRRILLKEHLIYGNPARVRIAPTAVVNNALFNVISGEIVVEDYAFFGHGVSLLTGTHDYRLTDEKRQKMVPVSGRDIVVGRGAWVGSNATVLGPCRIGEHAVVAAGAVVVGDVEAGTVVGGVPARRIKVIDFSPPPETRPVPGTGDQGGSGVGGVLA